MLGVVMVFTVLVSAHLSTYGGGGGGGGGGPGAAPARPRGRRREGRSEDVALELLELELQARLRGERPSPELGMEGLTLGKVKRMKATACYKGAECDSGLCVEGRCVCPLLYTGQGCVNVTRTPTKELSNHTTDPGSNPGSWCAAAFDHPGFFPAKPAASRGSAPLRTFLVQAMKGRAPDLPSMADFSTCAVVGSSGSLLERRLGLEIEAHTAVFRANDAPTQGYEAHVGRKTTLRVQNIAYCGFRERSTELTIHYTDNRRAHVGTVCTEPHIKRISPRMLAYSKTYWAKVRPPGPVDPTLGKAKLSGGFYAVMLALHLCGSVDVYGFDQHDLHYYDKVKQTGAAFAARHAWTYEKRCIKQLGQSGEKGTLRGRVNVF